jgi:dUTP pyrophosphatase
MSENKETCTCCIDCPNVKVKKDRPDAVLPTKGNYLAMGYDLTAIDVCKNYGDKITMFETGISVEPPEGYYTEILPRSSLSKTGYMLANSVGVIDPDYRGTLKLVLIKVDESKPDLVLPFTKCQLVLRKCEYFNVVETDVVTETERGSGGFGSTDLIPPPRQT